MAKPLASFEELNDTLWLERRALEHLLFKLVLANLMLAADDRRFVTASLAEIEHVVEGMRHIEAERDRTVRAAAAEWNVASEDLTLNYLAEHGPEALRTAFEGHRVAILELVTEIECMTQENRRLALVSLEGLRSALGLAEPLTYDAAGRRSRSGAASRVERVL